MVLGVSKSQDSLKSSIRAMMKKLGTEKILSAYVAKKKRGKKEAFAVIYPCLFNSILLGSASFLIFFFI